MYHVFKLYFWLHFSRLLETNAKINKKIPKFSSFIRNMICDMNKKIQQLNLLLWFFFLRSTGVKHFFEQVCFAYAKPDYINKYLLNTHIHFWSDNYEWNYPNKYCINSHFNFVLIISQMNFIHLLNTRANHCLLSNMDKISSHLTKSYFQF